MNESDSPTCEECRRAASSTFCHDCDEKMCKQCNELIHRGGKRKCHRREYTCICKSRGSQLCSTCQIFLCESCAYVHCHTTLEKISGFNSVAVFWDLASQKNVTEKELKETIESLTSKYQISFIKVYGEGYLKYRQIFNVPLVEFSNTAGARELETLLLDISLLSKENLSEVLIISSKARSFKAHLTQIQSAMQGVKILVSTSFPFLNFFSVKDIQEKLSGKLGRPASDYVQTGVLQVYQNFPRKKGQNYLHDLLVSILKELAETGLVMNETGSICKILAQRARLSTEESTRIIMQAEGLGHVHTIQKSFMDLKTMFFTCLKIDSLSYESLVWALRSLKQDEILPAERAVQSRVKEVFDYKISQFEWEDFIETSKLRHNHKKSSPLSYSLFSQSPASVRPSFTLKEIPDPVTKQKITLVYPKGEIWDSKDQFIKEGDVLGVKQTAQWQAFVQFLTEYFSACQPGDDSRAIPGGRYGCAQFLKYCGSPALKESSLGLISYMVQLSIDEFLLKYYRTLLVWVDNSPKVDEKENEKLLILKSKILEVLKENKEGLSLAQLPLYVKRKINFQINLAEMGFAKLKDLLLTMQEVEIELRGNNHPFAVFAAKKVGKRENETKKKSGEEISSQKLEKTIQEKQEFSVRWHEIKCKSIEEFVEKKCEDLERGEVFKRKGDIYFEDESKFLGFPGFMTYFTPFQFGSPPGFK